jgi:hypothetical protein
MFIRDETGRRRILRSGVIKSSDDSGKNIEVNDGGNGSTGTNHTHSNKSLLDGLSITSQKKLLSSGVPIATHMHEEAW